MKTIFKVSLFSLFIIACSEKNINKYIIPQEKLIPILCDFHIFDAASKQGIIPNNRNNLVRHKHYKSILKKYKIEKTKFDSTLKYYSFRPKEYKIIYEKVESELIKKLEKNQLE